MSIVIEGPKKIGRSRTRLPIGPADGFKHAAPPVSKSLSARLELPRWCRKTEAAVLTETCNFAGKSW
jgi:hypothetical protein